MNLSSLFTRTLYMMFRSAAIWVVVASMLLIQTFFGQLVGAFTTFTALLTGLVYVVVIAIIIGAVVYIFNEIAEGHSPSIIDAFNAGGRKALPLLLVQLVWQVPLRLAAWFATGEPRALIGPVGSPEVLSGSALIYLLGSFSLPQAVFMLISLCAGAIAIGTDRAVVLEDAPVPAALVRGWNLLREHLASYIKIGLAAVLVTLGLGLLASLLSSLVAGPAAFGTTASGAEIARLEANPLLTIALTFLSLAFSTLELILLTGVWTLAFRRWQGKEAKVVA